VLKEETLVKILFVPFTVALFIYICLAFIPAWLYVEKRMWKIRKKGLI
jgi:hypothetical protein